MDREGRRATVMMNTDDEQPEREPVPRALRERFDGLKPIRPIACKKPAAKTEEPRPLPKRGRLARLD